MNEPPAESTLSRGAGPSSANSLGVSVEKLLADQRQRWRQGERVTLETYLQQYPGLRDDNERLLHLLFSEFVLRERQGDAPRIEEFQQRFPWLADEIGLQFALDRVLKDELLAETLLWGDSPELSGDARRAEAAALPIVPGYEILGELGRGGMGVVYKARQVDLHRVVALKMLRDTAWVGVEEVVRFRHEAMALARLQHANIVQIHEIAEHGGHPYFALEYVADGSLARKLSGTPQPSCDVARLVRTLALAIHFAHEHGIIHRDLKPSNVLLTADGIPKISDFGLAKRLDCQTSPTRSGSILGTPSYMAPEQAEGKVKELGAAVDVYALGAILYEMLAGRPPFTGETPLDIIWQVVSQDPVPPSRLRPKVPADLETICLKCLEKQPSRRYARAADLADDLQRFLGSRPILARRASLAERAWKSVKRRPGVAALSAAIVLVAAIGFGLVVAEWRRAENAAEDERRLATELRSEMYVNLIARAQDELAHNNVGRAEELLGQTEVSLRGWEWHYLKRRRRGPARLLTHDSGRILHVAFCPDGRRVVWGTLEGAVSITDADSGTTRRLRPGKAGDVLLSLALHPNGRQAALSLAGILGGEVRILDLDTGQSATRFRTLGGYYGTAAYRPDGQCLAVSLDKDIKLFGTESGGEVVTLRGHTEPIDYLAFSPDGRWLGSASCDGTIKLWNLSTHRAVRTFGGAEDEARGNQVSDAKRTFGSKIGMLRLAFHPDGRQLAASNFEGRVKVWDRETGQELHDFYAGLSAVLYMTYSPDGKRLVTAGTNKNIQVWDAATMQELLSIRGHGDLVAGLSFSPNGQRLASASIDGSVRLWDGRPLRVGAGPEQLSLTDGSLVSAVAFSPNGRLLASGTLDGAVRLWDAESGREVRVLRGHTHSLTTLAFDAEGKRLVTAASDKTVRVWDAATGKQLLLLPNVYTLSVQFTPDGRHLVASSQKSVTKWDAATGAIVGVPLRVDLFSATAMDQSADGQRIATVGWQPYVRIWDVSKQPRQIRAFKGDDEQIFLRTAFSSDGRLLAAGSWDGRVQVWDTQAATDKPLCTLHHGERIFCVAFRPGRRQLASSSFDGTVKIWDIPSPGSKAAMDEAKPAATLCGHLGIVWSIAYDRQGRLATASGYRDKGEIKIWDAN